MNNESWYAAKLSDMDVVRICDSDNFVVDYDKSRGMYLVSVFEDGHFKDEYWFDAYEERELRSNEEILHLYFKGFVHGAAELMKYMYDYYDGTEPIWPSEMEHVLTKFLQQFGEVKNIDE